MQIEDRGLIYDSTNRPASERITCFASLCVTRRGTLYTAFQVGEVKNSPKSTLRLCRSRDGGMTWHESCCCFESTFAGGQGSLSNGELLELDDGRLLLISTWIDRRDPSRPFFDPESEGILHTRILKSFSSDEGESWSDWEEIPLSSPGWSYHSSGPILSCADGSIVFVAESHKSFDGAGPSAAAEGTWFMVSTDQGRTFQGPHLVAQHPDHRLFYWDARLAPGPVPGSWMALYWTHDQPNQHDLEVHSQLGHMTAEGVRPGPIHNTGVSGQIAAPMCLCDGRWLALVVNRDRPGTIKVWQSGTARPPWREAATIYIHADTLGGRDESDAALAEIWENIGRWGFGHPAIRPLRDDRALVTWYAGSSEGMSIHWARLNLCD